MTPIRFLTPSIIAWIPVPDHAGFWPELASQNILICRETTRLYTRPGAADMQRATGLLTADG
jgi:hypothetical protein